MPKSYQTFTAAGNAASYPLTDLQAQGYMNLSDLKVYLNGTLSTSGYSIVTSPSLALNFSAIPPNGTTIKVQRETNSNASGREVDFDNGTVLTAEDLDRSALQLLYIAQETNEGIGETIQKDFDGQWDAEGLRIKNAGNPVDEFDVVTKQYVDGIEIYGSGIAVPQAWTFTGNGSTTLFTLSPAAQATEANMFIVEVGGVIQRPLTSYTIPSPSQLQFQGGAPGNGVLITVRNFGASRSIANWQGNVTFEGTVDVNLDAGIDGNLTVGGNAAVAGSLTVDTGVLKVDAANNRVGINKTTPDSALDVVGDAAISGGLSVDTNVLKVDAANNFVGINKSVPTSALDVTGNIVASGSISATSGSFTSLSVTNGVAQVAQWMRAFGPTSSGVVTQGGFTLVNFATKAGSLSANFDLSTDYFTATQAGTYLFSATLNFGTPASENGMEFVVFASGIQVGSSGVSRWLDAGNHTLTAALQLSAGQQVALFFKGTYTTGVTGGFGGSTIMNNSMSVTFLGT